MRLGESHEVRAREHLVGLGPRAYPSCNLGVICKARQGI
jgi:hypothetical protein